MGENWIGLAVSIKCVGEIGVFQGIIKDADSSKIIISQAFRNGLPFKTLDAEVTIRGTDIAKISLIPSHNAANVNNGIPSTASNNRDRGGSPAHYTLLRKEINASPTQHAKMSTAKPKSPMSIKNAFGNFIPAKVEVKLAHNGGATNNTNNTKNGQSQARRSTSASIDTAEKNGGSSNAVAPSNIQMGGHKMDKKKNAQNRRFEKNIAFGTAVDDPGMDKDFDFEGNLALFDKRAIWDKIDANQKPDVVRQTGHANKKNYRHDENILMSKPMGFRQIKTKQAGVAEYVTDDGIVIPTISLALRGRIQMQAEVFGLQWERQCDMLARSTVEMALQMLGGARRLSPKNQHQWPKIAIVCDEMCNERHSDLGFATGRQLASQGLEVHILVKPNLNSIGQRHSEAELFKATGNTITMTVDKLPSCDLIILAVPKPITDLNVIKWISDSRASLMAVDPPPAGISNLNIKCSILPMLPLENVSASCGKLYLSNLAIPDKFFRDAGITYQSPFGHKFVIPLHTNNATAAKEKASQSQ